MMVTKTNKNVLSIVLLLSCFAANAGLGDLATGLLERSKGVPAALLSAVRAVTPTPEQITANTADGVRLGITVGVAAFVAGTTYFVADKVTHAASQQLARIPHAGKVGLNGQTLPGLKIFAQSSDVDKLDARLSALEAAARPASPAKTE